MGSRSLRSFPMKIALVAQHATQMAGDSTGQVDDARLRELSRSLARNGHRVTVYAQRNASAGAPRRAELEPGVTVEYVGESKGAAARGESELLAQVPGFA